MYTRCLRLRRTGPPVTGPIVLTAAIVFAAPIGFTVGVLNSGCGGSRLDTSTTRTLSEPAAAPTASDPTGAQPTLAVTVQEKPGADRWHVTYRLDQPALGLRFVRNRNNFRAARWRPVTPSGLRWRERDGFEDLVVAEGPPVREIQLEFDTFADGLAKDYDLNRVFSEGSRLLYTGHLAVVPLRCPGQPTCAVADATPMDEAAIDAYHWHFATANDRQVRVLDQVGSNALTWTPPLDHAMAGTYVYFGNLAPVDDGRFVAIIDPSMPAWMASLSRRFMLDLFRYYAEELGVELTFRPLILMSFGGLEQPGRSSGGGVLRGLIEMSAVGAGFRDDSPQARLQWHGSVAHEVFHLWNNDMFTTWLGSHEEWLTEGSADYFSFLALREAGVVDDDGFRRLLVRAANLCLTDLMGQPLLRGQRFASYYPCGATLMAWADGAAQRAGADIGTVFGHMFSAAAAHPERRYSSYDFLAQLERVTGDPLAGGRIERVLRSGIAARADELFARELRAAGFAVELVEPRAATLLPRHFASRLAGQLGRCACAAATNTRVRRDAIEIGPDTSCDGFRDRVRVTHVDGHHVINASAQAYHALLDRARRGLVVELNSAGGKQRLLCPQSNIDSSFAKLLRHTGSQGSVAN